MLPGNNLQDNLFMTPLSECPWCKFPVVCFNPSSESKEQSGNWFIGCLNISCDVSPHIIADNQLQAIKIWNTIKD